MRCIMSSLIPSKSTTQALRQVGEKMNPNKRPRPSTTSGKHANEVAHWKLSNIRVGINLLFEVCVTSPKWCHLTGAQDACSDKTGHMFQLRHSFKHGRYMGQLKHSESATLTLEMFEALVTRCISGQFEINHGITDELRADVNNKDFELMCYHSLFVRPDNKYSALLTAVVAVLGSLHQQFCPGQDLMAAQQRPHLKRPRCNQSTAHAGSLQGFRHWLECTPMCEQMSS